MASSPNPQGGGLLASQYGRMPVTQAKLPDLLRKSRCGTAGSTSRLWGRYPQRVRCGKNENKKTKATAKMMPAARNIISAAGSYFGSNMGNPREARLREHTPKLVKAS